MASQRPTILDHLGRPIERSVLTRDVSSPTIGSVQSILTNQQAAGLTPDRLASILRSAEAGDVVRYLELAEQMEERDLHYLSVLGIRKRQVSQLDITVEAATDDKDDVANADLVRDWLNRLTLQDDIFDILDAVGKGVSVTEIVWQTSESQWWPDKLMTLQTQWLQPDRVTGQEMRIRDGSADGLALAPFKFIDHRVKAKSGLPMRAGLARAAAWCWMFKNYAVKDWVAFAEVYGLPLRLGRYEPGASAEDKRTLLRAVTDISSDAAAIVPKSMEIEFVKSEGTTSGDLFEKLADWCDRQVSKAVLGQTGTTDSQKGSGYAQAKVQDGVREDIEQADAKQLATTLTLQLMKPLIDLNRGAPRSGKYPLLSIGRAEAWDAAVNMPLVEKFVSMGGRVEASVVRDKLGLPDPPENRPDGKPVELLKPAAKAAPDTPPENAPQGRQGPAPLRVQPDIRQAASYGVLEAFLAASAGQGGGADAVDAFTGELDWEPLVSPLRDRVVNLVREAPSMEAAAEQLAALLAEPEPMAQLRETIARAMLEGRLSGLIGLELGAAPAGA